MSKRRVTQSIIDRVRRSVLLGLPPADVAARHGLAADEILELLRRSIHGRLAATVRGRISAGESAESIAEGLRLPLADVQGFLDRLTLWRGAGLRSRPRNRARQAAGPAPPRPREPRPRIRPEWGGLCDRLDDDDQGDAPEVLEHDQGDVPEVLEPPAMPPAAEWDGPSSPHHTSLAAGRRLADDDDQGDAIEPTPLPATSPSCSRPRRWREPATRTDPRYRDD